MYKFGERFVGSVTSRGVSYFLRMVPTSVEDRRDAMYKHKYMYLHTITPLHICCIYWIIMHKVLKYSFLPYKCNVNVPGRRNQFFWIMQHGKVPCIWPVFNLHQLLLLAYGQRCFFGTCFVILSLSIACTVYIKYNCLNFYKLHTLTYKSMVTYAYYFNKTGLYQAYSLLFCTSMVLRDRPPLA